jgi:hypothetical protein
MKRRAHLPVMLLCVLFAALTVPFALLGRVGTSEANDQERFHWPTILAMSENWPTVTLEEYRTATGPLYHAALAAVVAVTTSEQWPVRVVNALASLPLIVAVYALVRRRAPPWHAALLVLPLALSAYVLSSAIWITTDNVAHWFVVFALLLVTARANDAKRTAIASSICAALATAVRQIHLWLVAPIAVAHLMRMMSRPGAYWARATLIAALMALPAMIVVTLLAWWWGGLTPPFVEARNAPVGNTFAFGFMISLVGFFGMFYLPLMQPWQDRSLRSGRVLPVVVLMALALTLLSPTTLSKAEGRWGGPIWWVVDHAPTIAGRSVVFPPLAVLGAVVLLAGCRRAAALGRSFEASVVLVALASFTVAHAVQPWCAQRYFEPMVLIFVTWLASLCIETAERNPSHSGTRVPLRTWLGPAILSAIQLLLSCYTVYWVTRPVDIAS